MNAPEDRLGKSVIAVMSAARPLFPHEQTFAGTHRTAVSCHCEQPAASQPSLDHGSPRPSALAVLALITSSRRVGGSIGKPEGRDPWRILPTRGAARRYASNRLAP